MAKDLVKLATDVQRALTDKFSDYGQKKESPYYFAKPATAVLFADVNGENVDITVRMTGGDTLDSENARMLDRFLHDLVEADFAGEPIRIVGVVPEPRR
jgi:hypothetical protein